MASLTLEEFEKEIYQATSQWKWGEVPIILKLTPTSIKIRIYISHDIYIDCFFNEVTKKTSFTLVKEGGRIFGANNTGGWHIHPFENPSEHNPLVQPLSFSDFLEMVGNLSRTLQKGSDLYLPGF